MEQLPGWNNYLGSILRLGWNNYLDGTTTWVRTCVLRPLGHSLYQLSYVEHLPPSLLKSSLDSSSDLSLDSLSDICHIGFICSSDCSVPPGLVCGEGDADGFLVEAA